MSVPSEQTNTPQFNHLPNSTEAHSTEAHEKQPLIPSPKKPSAQVKPSTVGQLMRVTAQALQRLYRDKLGHSPIKVSCHLITNKLLIWVEGSITHAEKMVAEFADDQLQSVRTALDEGLYTVIAETVEASLEVKVVTLLTDTCYQQECTSWVVVLAEPPQVRVSKRSSPHIGKL